MFFKRSNGEFRETDRVTRFKLIKSGKNWLRAATSNFGLLKVIRGQVEETVVAEVREDAVSVKEMTSRGLLFGLIIAELALVFIITGALQRLSLTTATLLFIVYSVLNGAMLSSVFVVYTMTSIAKVFFITAGTFGAMAFYGYTTKKDLTSLGKILFMALIGLIIATIVNMFLKSSGFDYILSYAGVAIFVGLTAWDSQKIKQMLQTQYDMSEGAQKLALIGALTLYLDFINLFLYLLRIFGGSNKE